MSKRKHAIRPHRRATLPLIDRLAFERLLAELGARFADVPADAVMAEINRALSRLVDFFSYDRCTYSEFGTDNVLRILASAATPGVAPHAVGPFDGKQEWFLAELRAGRPVVLPTLPQALPRHAKAEIEHVVRVGLQSHLSIPLRVHGHTTGVLSFAGFRKARDWPRDVLRRLTIIAELFSTSVARLQAEEESRALRGRLWHADRVAHVSALSAAIAHELNQPLTAILSNAQAGLVNLARGGMQAEQVRAILEAVVREDKRAAETIRAMRALLRHDESGRDRIDVAAALRDVLGLLAGELGRKAIRIETQLESGCWATADRTQIEQVALNLMLNAAAAMEGCPPQERVLKLTAARSGARIAVEVRDTGIGIAPEKLASVFEPFWTTRSDGLGLGLEICRSIVEAHGGTISAERNPDRGMSFRFELAADASAETTQKVVTSGIESMHGDPTMPSGGPVVCVIDDDAAVRASLVRLLSAGGWASAAYASAAQFLARQPLATVGCILLDRQIPGMSGLELQQQLATYGTAPPVVFLTGHGDVAASVQAMKLGAVDFLTKPVDASVLIEVVGKALARHAKESGRARERETCLARLSRLSAREREVMAHVIRGRLNKQIASDLDIVIQTVKQHRSRVMEKMEARSVAELVRMCEGLGVLDGRAGI